MDCDGCFGLFCCFLWGWFCCVIGLWNRCGFRLLGRCCLWWVFIFGYFFWLICGCIFGYINCCRLVVDLKLGCLDLVWWMICLVSDFGKVCCYVKNLCWFLVFCFVIGMCEDDLCDFWVNMNMGEFYGC